MIYVLSDIHGHEKRFASILKQINLQPEDTLYVLGDVIDRHPGGVMLSVVCFDLVTEAVETNVGVWTVVGSIAFGVAITYFLNYLIDRKTNP